MGSSWSAEFAAGLALVVCAQICSALSQEGASPVPQQFDRDGFLAASAKATQYCVTLWSDHSFDPLRDKIPLLGEQPTSSMLTNKQRLSPEDKPLADFALKTAAKCKAVMVRVWTTLPPPANTRDACSCAKV
jgi:hypothetical protein